MVEEFCEEPFNFGKCEEWVVTASALCEIWRTPTHTFNLSFLKNGRQRQIFIPELMYKSVIDDLDKSGPIKINFSFMSDEDVNNFVGKNEINFGTYAVTGMDMSYQQIIVPVQGKVSPDSKSILIQVANNESGNFKPILYGSRLPGTVSTTITFEIFENDPDSQEPPAKEPLTDEEGDDDEDEIFGGIKF